MPKRREPQEKDIRIEVRVRNNLILKKMEAAGIASVAVLANRCGISNATLYRLVNMMESPLSTEGGWKPSVLQLAETLRCSPEELFSAEQTENVLTKNRSFAEARFAEVQAAIASLESDALLPENIVLEKELKSAIDGVLATLKPREAEVLRLRFGIGCKEHTLKEISVLFGCSGDWIRQIEDRALRNLRRSSREGPLADFLSEGEQQRLVPWR